MSKSKKKAPAKKKTSKKQKPVSGGKVKGPPRGQKALPGMEPPPPIQEIITAAEDYQTVRDKRMDLTRTEIELRTTLGHVMKKHNVTQYQFEDRKGVLREAVILPATEEKVKVRKVGSASDPEAGEEPGLVEEGEGEGGFE